MNLTLAHGNGGVLSEPMYGDPEAKIRSERCPARTCPTR